MKLIIAGGRDIQVSTHFIEDCYNLHFPVEEYPDYPEEVVSGKCRGIDACGEEWAKTLGKCIIKDFPYPSGFKTAGGPIRNRQMAEYGDALLLIWNGESKGSANMKQEMEKLGKPICEVIIRRSK